MQYEFMIENGEIYVSDSEIVRLSEALEISEDEVMDLISENIEEMELQEGFRDKVKELGGKALGKIQKTNMYKNLETKISRKAYEQYLTDQKQKFQDKWEDAKAHPGKTGAKLAVGALAAYGAGHAIKKGAQALKKRKAKKAEEEAMKAEDVMIDIFLSENGDIFVDDIDMDFLLEAYDYDLNQEDIEDLLCEAFLNEYTPDIETLNKVSQRQAERANRIVLDPNASDDEKIKAYNRFGRQQERMQRYVGKAGGQMISGPRQMTDEESNAEREKLFGNDNNGEGNSTETKEKAKQGFKEKVKEIGGKARDLVYKDGKLTTGGKVAIGAAALAGTGAAAYGIHKALKKRNAKKKEDAKKLEDVMIDVFFNEDGDIFIDDIDMDFLLEACDYELNQNDIMDNIDDVLISEMIKLDQETFRKLGNRIDERKFKVLNDPNATEEEKEKARQRWDKQVKRLVANLDKQVSRERESEGTDVNEKKDGLISKAKTVGKDVYEKVKGKIVDDEGKLTKGAKIGGGIAAGALTVGGLTAGAIALKKRKAKKAKEEAMKAEDVMIEYLIFEDTLYVQEEDVDFLLEACDYELSESQILDLIMEAEEEEAKKGFKEKAGEMWEKAKGHAGGAWQATKDFAGTTPGKVVIGAGAVGAGLATGLGIRHALKKRNAKKNQNAQKLEDVMIEVLVSEGVVYMDEIDMDFLLEASDYELSESEIMDAILAEAQDTMGHIPGQKVVITSSRELAKIEEKQLDDIPERVKDGKLGNEEVAASTANVGKKEIQESVEYDEYAETFEGDHLIMEAILEDAGIELSEAQMQALIEANLLSERSIVRLDKAAKRTQAEKKALVVIAREQGDPLYKKLVKVYKQKNDILDKLDSKYGTRAIARVRGNARKIDKED